MSFNNFSAPHFSAPHSWAPTFPQTLNTIQYAPLVSDDRPSNFVGLRPDYYIFGARDGQELPAPAFPQVPALETVPEVTEAVEAERPAKRQRLLAAAPARDGTRIEGPAPAPVQRTRRAHVRTSGRQKVRAPQACDRCRRERKGCLVVDSGSKCVPCKRLKVACTYSPTPKQLALAQKQAAENADPSVGYPPANPTSPMRRILPQPQAPTAGYRRLIAAGPAQQRQYPEAPGSSFGGFAAGSEARPQHPEGYNGMFGGFAAGPDAQQEYPRKLDLGFGGFAAGPYTQQEYPRRLNLGFGGMHPRSNRISQQPQGLNGGLTGFGTTVDEFRQRPQVPNSAFGESDTRPSGYLQYPQQPPRTFGGLSTRYTDFTQRPKHPASEFGGYPPTPSGTSSTLGQPGSAIGSSPAGVSPYARDPAVGFDGRPPSSHGDLPKPPEWRQTRQG